MSEVMPVSKEVKMKGWKTKLGSCLICFAFVLMGILTLTPGHTQVCILVKFLAYNSIGFGAAFSIWGLGHKIEKSRTTLIKKIPYYLQKIDPNDLKLLRK